MPDRRNIFVFLACAMIVGLLFGLRAVISIATVLILINTLFTPNIKSNIQRFLSYKPAWAFLLIFATTIFSGLFSDDTATWLEWLRIRLGFFIFPIAIMGLPPLSKKHYYGLLYCFFFTTLASTLMVGFEYLSNYEEYTAGYGMGRSMNTPILYVRYSLFIAFAIVSGSFLFLKKFVLKFRWERYLIAAAVLFLALFIHVLAVRTGLFALYNTIFLTAIYWIIRDRKWLAGLAVLFAMVCIPVLAYYNVPSLQNKIKYMKWDLGLYLKGDAQMTSSDYGRLISIENALRITHRDGWLVGTGIGDLRGEMNKYYEAHQPNIGKKLLPHNQYIFVLASTGLIGLAIFLFASFYPLFYQKNYRFWFFVCFHIITFSSFLAEMTVELQYGQSFYLLFVLAGMSFLNGEEGIEEKTESNTSLVL